MYVVLSLLFIVGVILTVDSICRGKKPSEKAIEIAEGTWHLTPCGMVDSNGRLFNIGSGKITLYMEDVLSFNDVMYLQTTLWKLYIRMCACS